MIPLFLTKKRFIDIYGGRGSAKSWTVADFLLLKALESEKRVLCTREIQNSIKDSVHRLLTDKIQARGLDKYYKITEKNISGTKNGSEFIFKGLHRNANDIKSTEGIDYCWVEEAHSVSRASLEILTPTIRKDGSQIIFVYNPTGVEDPVHADYTLADRDDIERIQINYSDNPWFPDVLKQEMEYDRKNDPDKYAHKWLGQCVMHADAQIFYGKWKIEDFQHKDEILYFGADWGFAGDPSAAVRNFVRDKTLYIDYEVFGYGVDIDKLPALFSQIPGMRENLSIGDSSRPETISYMQRHGFPKMKKSYKGAGSIEEGISHLRSYEKIVIHPRCKNVIDEFRLYCYKMNKLTGAPTNVPEDKHNHCFTGDTLILTQTGYKFIDSIKKGDYVMTREGFKKVIKVFNNGLKEIKNYNLLNNHLMATDTHNIITSTGKKEIKYISPGDEIYIWSDFLWKLLKTRNTKRSYIKAVFIDAIQTAKGEAIEFISDILERLAQYFYTGKYIKTASAQSLPVSQYIIKIRIPIIIISKILNVCRPGVICLFILNNTIRNIVRKLKQTLIKSGLLLQYGIEAKRAENGISYTRQNLQSTISFARIVINSLYLLKMGIINFVQMLVNQMQGVKEELIILKKNAAYVGMNLKQTNMQKSELVQKVVAQNLRIVYDLQIADKHEYIANNILVSNSIDALRYSQEDIMRHNFGGIIKVQGW